MAIEAIPTLVSIFDRYRELFSRSSIGSPSNPDEERKEGEV